MAARIMLLPFTICVLVCQLLFYRVAGTAAAATVTIPTGGAAAPPTAATLGGGLPQLPFPFPGSTARGLPQLPFPFPGGSAASTDCMKAVQHADRCVGDVLRSLASPPGDAARVGAACCGAIQAVGDACFRGVLPLSPFRALYAPLVRQVCRIPLSLMPRPSV